MLLVPAALLVGLVSRTVAARESVCSRACASALAPVRFNDSTSIGAESAEQPCRSRLALTSLYVCLDINCGSDTRKAALGDVDATCRQQLGLPLPVVSVNYTSEEIAGMQRINRNESFGTDRPLGHVVLPSAQLFRAWYETLDAYDYVVSHHHLYARCVILFWIAVVGLGLVNRLALALCVVHENTLAQPQLCRKGKRWLKRRLLIPATFGYRCAQSVWWATVPPRCQSLTVGLFLLVNAACCVWGYRFVGENLYFPTLRKQVLRYVADRTGILAYANFPLIWVFGMRNNIAIWLTGWNYTTYNNFHRWIGRISVVQAVVHSIAYTALVLQGGWSYYLWYFTLMFWNAGVLATVAMCALLAFSILWMRRHRYETFLVMHIGLSIVLLLAMLGHVSIFHGQYNGVFWACVYIWVLDRLTRVFRVIAFNPRCWSVDTWASYDAAANMVCLSVPLTAAYKVHPGTYFYLMVLDASRCWESHPFTVACVADSAAAKPRFPGEQAPRLESEAQDDQGHLQFLIRPYDGFTRRLRDLAAEAGASQHTLRVLVEGPYGHSQPLHRYDHVVFIVGGSGVVVPLSYIPSLVTHKTGPHSIHVHWAVREPAFAAHVVMNHAGVNLGVDVYLPAVAPTGLPDPVPFGVRLHTARLDVGATVSAAAMAARPHERVVVVACGPARMVDDARSAVVEALAHAQCQVDYMEESW